MSVGLVPMVKSGSWGLGSGAGCTGFSAQWAPPGISPTSVVLCVRLYLLKAGGQAGKGGFGLLTGGF